VTQNSFVKTAKRFKGKNMSKGGGGGGTQTVTTSIDPQIKEQYLKNLEQAKSVAAGLGVQQFAGFNPLYQQGEEQITNLGQQINQITDLGLKPFTGADIQEFMNPYEQQVIQGTLGDIEQSRQMAALQNAQQASAAKAFGGSRYGVQQSLTDQASLAQAAKTAAQMRQAGYGQATQTALSARNLGLQGRQLGLQGAQLGFQGAQAVMNAGSARQQLEQARLDAARNIGLQKLGVTQSALGLQPANVGGTTTQPTYRNQAAGALGGAAAGYQLGGPVGAGIGGLIGLLG
jgi:hypothetical protein